MLDMKIAYPEFVPNQILTNTQLNQLREHLEQEDRLTRVRLAGTGIVCGLHGRKVTAPAHGIQIVLGYGVTSDGELLELCRTTAYTHYRAYADPDRDEENKLRYVLWRKAADPTEQLDIVELIPKEVMDGDDPPEATAFTAATLGTKTANRVLVLYLEHEPVDLNSCLVTSCDNKGRNINVNVRALLVLKADLTAEAGCAAAPPIHRIPRHHTKGVPQPGNTAAQIQQAFGTIVSENVGAVSANIKTLFDAYAPFLDIQTVAADPLAGKLTGAQIAQYRYDALLDFASAYNEAAAAAYTLLKECCPTGSFPRHLMLGVLDGSAGEGFRNEFVPSPLRNVMHGETARVRGLFARLEKMIGGLALAAHPAAAGIQPSHTAAHTLGRRAQPYYFDATVAGVWRPRPRCTVDAEWPWRHPAIAAGLAADYAESTLLRIEGHVGDPCQAARTELVQKRDQGNAEFHVVCSYIDDGAADERQARAEVMALLDKPPEAIAAAREAFEGFVTKGDGDIGAILELSKQQQEWLAKIAETSRGWVDLRDRRALHCDTAALAYDYLEARGELLCLAGRLRAMALRLLGDLEAIEDDAFVGPGMEEMLLGIEYTLVDRLLASVLAEPDRWAAEDEVSEVVKDLAGTPVQALRSTLRFYLLSLLANLQRLESSPPQELAEFDYDAFAYFFRILLADLREFWHWTRALGFEPAGAATETGRKLGDAPLHAAEAAVLAADWLALHGCQLAQFATAFTAYEAARARDVSLFRNLARIDGLEHLAGVSKGGTFVLVCDRPSNDGKVIADFSLEGCLPCCCDVDLAELCLPPFALPDVRVVTLEPARIEDRIAGFREVDLEINVAANDCDLNGAPTKRAIELLSETSERGATLEADSERGVVHYHIDAGKPLPRMVDRFSYRLRVEGEKCEGEAIGHAIVIFTAKPVLIGRIEGIVWRENGERGDDAIVTIKETGASLMTSGSGEFAFEDIPRGDYSLFATQDQMTSDVVTVRVENGQTAFVDLILKEAEVATGAIMVRVRDTSGAVIPGAKVTLTSEGAAPRFAATNDKGIAAFLNLPPGTYVGKVEMPGLAAGTTPPTALAAGQTLAVDVELAKSSGVVVVPGGLVEHVATTRDVRLLDASVAVRRVLADRHAKHILTFNTATDDPRILRSDEYVGAAKFLGEGLDPRAADEAVAAAYKETSTALATAARAASGDAKTAYQKVLTAVSTAYLDRIALSNPKTLPAGASTEVKSVVRTLKNAEVAVADVHTTWEGNTLKDAIGVGTTDAILGLLV